MENCQLGVFLAYASPLGRALIDAELYLPKSWTSDPARCTEAGVPGDIEFATKPVLARQMLARALDAGLPVSWATADEAYGMDYKFRHFLEQRRVDAKCTPLRRPASHFVIAISRMIVGLGRAWSSWAAGWSPALRWSRLGCGSTMVLPG